VGGNTGVAIGATVASQFTADGAGRAVKHGSDSARTVTLLEQAGNRYTIFGLQMAVYLGNVWHLLTLSDEQVLHFKFEPAIRKMIRDLSEFQQSG
jgi:hypothetical protein